MHGMASHLVMAASSDLSGGGGREGHPVGGTAAFGSLGGPVHRDLNQSVDGSYSTASSTGRRAFGGEFIPSTARHTPSGIPLGGIALDTNDGEALAAARAIVGLIRPLPAWPSPTSSQRPNPVDDCNDSGCSSTEVFQGSSRGSRADISNRAQAVGDGRGRAGQPIAPRKLCKPRHRSAKKPLLDPAAAGGLGLFTAVEAGLWHDGRFIMKETAVWYRCLMLAGVGVRPDPTEAGWSLEPPVRTMSHGEVAEIIGTVKGQNGVEYLAWRAGGFSPLVDPATHDDDTSTPCFNFARLPQRTQIIYSRATAPSKPRLRQSSSGSGGGRTLAKRSAPKPSPRRRRATTVVSSAEAADAATPSQVGPVAAAAERAAVAATRNSILGMTGLVGSTAKGGRPADAASRASAASLLTSASSPSRPFECSDCSSAFAEKSDLQRHCRTHTGEKPYKCGACDKRFAQIGTRNRHELIHSGARPFGCMQCELRFTQSGHAAAHARTHTITKPSKMAKRKKL